jgi:hypothetical protein
MVGLDLVEEQLRRAGCNFRFRGRAAVKELPNILMTGEVIQHCVNGRYEGGFALLCVTNHRLLLIDRKLMFLNLEDIRFDMIAELDYSKQVFDGTIHIITPSRKLTFMSWNQVRLRELMNYVQLRVMEVRQHYMLQQFTQQPADPQVMAGMVGGLAMQSGNNMPSAPPPQLLNTYTTMPLLNRRRHYPKFY